MMGEESSTAVSSIANCVSSALVWLTSHGVAYGGGESRFRLNVISPDAILLESRDDDELTMRLQRAP